MPLAQCVGCQSPTPYSIWLQPRPCPMTKGSGQLPLTEPFGHQEPPFPDGVKALPLGLIWQLPRPYFLLGVRGPHTSDQPNCHRGPTPHWEGQGFDP